ncbi:Leucine-rich repeat-containing protein 4C [Eufriesea mexicana]|uniref:Leucine-rich repeat-containing protein 4C n=1 Tax=Eufriesea mexicana TaxID=516756 RepID=A0A310SK35_9HYME|nr:Leucine-rich repeat-containing protein 4C [Eufriesea mexicana]
MTVVLILVLTLLNECFGQIIDIGDIWEVKCPPGCSCEVQKFADLPLHRWIRTNPDQNLTKDDNFELVLNMDHSIIPEFLKVAICVVAEDYEELLDKLPSDIQVFTILQSGMGDFEILLQSTTFQRFTDLMSLDIQGIDYNELMKKNLNSEEGKQRGIILSVDSLYPLGLNLLYLNLERVKLTSLSPTRKNKANLVVKPMNTVTSDENRNNQLLNNKGTGHRLIFLSQQNSGESDDKEILPYDVYKQEMEGYRETVGLFTGLGALTHLRVYDCDLKDISWHMFDGLNSLVHLSLEKNSLKFIPEFCFYGTPNLKVLSLARLSQLQILYLYNLEIPVLERFVFQGMPELLKLKARGNISSIEFDAFVDLIKLVDLDLSHCHIRKISMDAFYGLQNVKRIDLSNNELEFISPGLFGVQQQKQLREIILSKNKLTSLPVDFFKILRISNKQSHFASVRLDGNPWDCTCSMATWNPHFINRLRETAPRCSTPKKLKNWGIFHALRKGGLQCRTLRRRHLKKSTMGKNNYEDNIIS